MAIRILLIILCFPCLWSCSDDSPSGDCNSVNFVVDFKQEQDAISEAQFAYLIDDSQENCETAKMLVSDYVAILEQFENCEFSGSQEEAYRSTLDELRDYLSTLPC